MTIVPGVLEFYGNKAKEFRYMIRKIEDILDDKGFKELHSGLLIKDKLFKKNLDFLGHRFMENLVYVNLNGEDEIVILPEGTMRTYDFMVRNNLNKAKIFYS